jgi:hypothetical protein
VLAPCRVRDPLTGTLFNLGAEETGVTIKVTGLAGVYSDPGHVLVYPSGDGIYQQFAVCFPAFTPDSDAWPDRDETSAAAWFDAEQATQLAMHPAMRQRLTDALAESNRAHFYQPATMRCPTAGRHTRGSLSSAAAHVQTLPGSVADMGEGNAVPPMAPKSTRGRTSEYVTLAPSGAGVLHCRPHPGHRSGSGRVNFPVGMTPEVFLLKLRGAVTVFTQRIRRAVQESDVTGRVEILQLVPVQARVGRRGTVAWVEDSLSLDPPEKLGC